MTPTPTSTLRSQSRILNIFKEYSISGFISSPSDFTIVLQDNGKLVILLAKNEPGCFTRSQPNLLFC